MIRFRTIRALINLRYLRVLILYLMSTNVYSPALAMVVFSLLKRPLPQAANTGRNTR